MKGDAKIDLLAPDGLGTDPVETGKGCVVQAPGATKAVERAETIIVELADERFEVRTPNLLGAIVAKSAAATEIVSATRFDREKHERDLATLLMCAARDPKFGTDGGGDNEERSKAADLSAPGVRRRRPPMLVRRRQQERYQDGA